MIKRIELKNFEIHEHIVLDDLSSGFNLICGDSNSGKTAIIRAILLAGFGDFNPRSVRVGCRNCEVTIDTDRGRVYVTRGKDNIWEVTPIGEKTEIYRKVGQKVPPRATEIIGLSKVKLGDIDLNVNVMGQLEGHFMLAELEGKKSSGSLRAEIIDEISGMAGAEGLIKEVSLDGLRWGKEIKSLEQRINELQEQRNNESELEQEKELLDAVDSLLTLYDEHCEVIDVLTPVKDEVVRLVSQIGVLEERIKSFPDFLSLEEIIERVSSLLQREKLATKLLNSYRKDMEDLENCELKIKKLEKVLLAADLLDECKKLQLRLKILNNFLIEFSILLKKIEGNRILLESADKKKLEIESELDKMIQTFTVCPLTLQPIKSSCLEGDIL